MLKINKKVGFWTRFLSNFIDIFIFCIMGISSSLICLKKTIIIEESISFNAQIYLVINYMYYVWLIVIMLFLLIQYIFIPMAFDGKTIGMLITRIKLDYNNQNKFIVILKRSELGPFLWIFIIILFMIFVWPDTINKMIIYNNISKNYQQSSSSANENLKLVLEKYKLNILEISFYSIPSILSPIIVLIQVFLLLSINFKGNKIGLIDKFTNSQIIYKNKYEEINNDSLNIIEPEKNIQYKIEWKE